MIEEKVMINVLQHKDCRNFCSMDVAKGICRRTQDIVQIDGQACADYAQLPKCKFCANYTASDKEGMGTCNAESDHPWAYPEMIAITCENFKSA
jgi:4-hydroxyphenylacetate decarboxylase small subunit